MNITKCPNCDKFVHIGSVFGNSCLYCGATINFHPDSDDSLLATTINACEAELQSGNFAVAVKKYDDSLDRFPNISRLFWGRFLALHKCKDDLDLIIKGIVFDADPDYINANHFGKENERECYSSLSKTRSEVAQLVLEYLTSLEKEAIADTGIVNEKQKSESEVGSLQDTVTKQILDLESIEKAIRDKAADCNVLLSSSKTRIKDNVSKLETLKSKLKNLSEVTHEDTEDYMEKMALNLSICSHEWSDMQSFKRKPQFIEYDSLLKQQSEAERTINNTVSQINQVNERLSRIIATIGVIKSKYNTARTEMKNGSFAQAKELIHSEAFTQITRKFVQA